MSDHKNGERKIVREHKEYGIITLFIFFRVVNFLLGFFFSTISVSRLAGLNARFSRATFTDRGYVALVLLLSVCVCVCFLAVPGVCSRLCWLMRFLVPCLVWWWVLAGECACLCVLMLVYSMDTNRCSIDDCSSKTTSIRSFVQKSIPTKASASDSMLVSSVSKVRQNVQYVKHKRTRFESEREAKSAYLAFGKMENVYVASIGSLALF